MKNFKKTAAIVLAAALSAAGMNAFAAETKEIKVYNLQDSELSVEINGVAIDFGDSKPFIDENNRTQFPVRAISEGTGASVEWDDSTRTVTITSDETVIVMTIGSKYMMVGDVEWEMDTEPVIINDRTYVPAVYIAQPLWYNVYYVTDSQDFGDMTAESGSAEINAQAGVEYVVYTEDDIPAEIEEALAGSTVQSADGDSVLNLADGAVEDSLQCTKNGTAASTSFVGVNGSVVVEYDPENLDELYSGDDIGNFYTWINFSVKYMDEDSQSTQGSVAPMVKIPINKRSVIVFNNLDVSGYGEDSYFFIITHLIDFENQLPESDTLYDFRVKTMLYE